MGSTNQSSITVSNKRCFNCGDAKHPGRECPHKSKGSKCYSCGEFGHTVAKCPRGSESVNKNSAVVRVDTIRSHGDKKIYKDVKILGKNVTAIIDSGSDLHLVRSSFYVQLGAPRIRPEAIKFDRMGATNRTTLGRFSADVIIDGLTFVLNVDVVPDHFMTHGLIIGGELSNFAVIRICKQQATLKKFDDRKHLRTCWLLTQLGRKSYVLMSRTEKIKTRGKKFLLII